MNLTGFKTLQCSCGTFSGFFFTFWNFDKIQILLHNQLYSDMSLSSFNFVIFLSVSLTSTKNIMMSIYTLSTLLSKFLISSFTDWRVPIDMPEISDINEESRSLKLFWKPRQMSPFDKTPMKYHVESWEPRGRKWRPIASGIPDTSYRVTGLPLDRDHLFRVRAEAASALSEPTYPVSLSRFRCKFLYWHKNISQTKAFPNLAVFLGNKSYFSNDLHILAQKMTYMFMCCVLSERT